MKQNRIWLVGLFLLLSACRWEEEPTLAEIYAGTYRGEMQVLPPPGLETKPVDGQVDMVVAGDRALLLKFLNVEIAGVSIDTLVVPALLSLDGRNRLSGECEGVGGVAGQAAQVKLEGEMVYDRSDITIHFSAGAEENIPELQWVVKFRGIRE